MSEPIVTYLLGAGASAKAVPVVANLPQRMSTIHSLLQSNEYVIPENEKQTAQVNHNYEQNRENFIEDLDWLINEQPNYVNIDDYARQLFASGADNRKYWRLKTTLSAYLMIEQGLRSDNYAIVDPRYRAFLGKLVATDGTLQLNNNVRILNWNYDYQLELAFMDLRNFSSLSQADDHFQIIPSEGTNTFSTDHFSMIKLNGTAGLYQINDEYKHWPYDHRVYDPSDAGHKIPFVNNALDFHKHFRSGWTDSQLHFNYAWDKEGRDSSLLKTAISAVESTEQLVVIGYSFPRYNRVIDTNLLASMSDLKSVTIQTKEDTAKETERRFNQIRPGLNPSVVTNTNEFEFPPELEIR